MITSTQNQTIKNLARLKNKKDRMSEGKFLVEGLHMIQEADEALLLDSIYAIEGYDQELPMQPEFCTQPVLNKLSSQKSDAVLIGVCHFPTFADPLDNHELRRYLLLDRIQDPGNLGTLIRSAYAFGIQAVLCSQECADLFSSKVLQSSQGAAFHLPVVYTDLHHAIDSLQKRHVDVYAAALHHDSLHLHGAKIPESYGLMIGNEGQGIREDLIRKARHTILIEMQAFESLNAAVAGSILMYAFQFPTHEMNR